MKKIIYIFFSLAFLLLAIPAMAATATDFKSLVNNVFISGILQPLVPLLIGLGVVVFLYGVLILMFSEGGEKKEEGKQYMLWGIIGIFVMVSVWGLVSILSGSFNLDNTPPTIEIDIPNV
jgi:hypothetical protein